MTQKFIKFSTSSNQYFTLFFIDLKILDWTRQIVIKIFEIFSKRTLKMDGELKTQYISLINLNIHKYKNHTLDLKGHTYLSISLNELQFTNTT